MHDHDDYRGDRGGEGGSAGQAWEAGKALLRLAGRKALEGAGRLAARGLAALAGTVGWPLLLAAAVLILTAILFAAFYSAMPGQTALTGVEPSERDREVRQCAEERVSRWNVEETWLVPGEGAWYPKKGTARLGRLCDRYGRDARLANQWGDPYAVVLYLAAQEKEDKMADMSWVRERLEDATESLRPWFYYKESYVEYCGKDGCERETVYLLVEAYTIRGHYRWTHEWVTETYPDGSSVTYERIKDTIKLSDGLPYIEDYIVPLYNIVRGEDSRVAARAVSEAGQAFNARVENLAWLLDSGATLASLVSCASIPPEFLDALEEASRLTGIPVWFLAGLIEKESSWDPNAVNDKTGCFGLTQLDPRYWPERARRYGFDPEKDKWNPRAQIIVGAYVLKDYLGSVDWDWEELDLDNPPERLKRALAKYGGYGSDVAAARGYIEDVLRLAEAYRSRPAVWPVPGYYEISSHFGMRFHPVLHVWKVHEGIDIPAPEGATVVSVSAGVVAAAGWGVAGDAYGIAVLVRDAQHEYLYAHLSSVSVRQGQVVRPGTKLGEVGQTGVGTGPHLHFGVRPIGGDWIDPEPLLRNLR